MNDHTQKAPALTSIAPLVTQVSEAPNKFVVNSTMKAAPFVVWPYVFPGNLVDSTNHIGPVQQCAILIPVILGEHEAQEITKGCTAGKSLGEGGPLPNDTKGKPSPGPSPGPNATGKRQDNAMKWLLAEDEGNPSNSHIQTYIEKRNAYIAAEDKKITVFQGAYRKVIDDLRAISLSIEKQCEAYNLWLRDDARDIQNEVEAAYKDWIINGRKEAVEYWFALVGDDSAFGPVQEVNGNICKGCGAKATISTRVSVTEEEAADRDRESQEKVSSEIDAKQGIAQYTWKVAQLKRKDTMLELSKEAPGPTTNAEMGSSELGVGAVEIKQLSMKSISATSGLSRKTIAQLDEEIKMNEDAITLLEAERKKLLTSGSIIDSYIGGAAMQDVSQQQNADIPTETKESVDYLKVSPYLTSASRRGSVSSLSGLSVQSSTDARSRNGDESFDCNVITADVECKADMVVCELPATETCIKELKLCQLGPVPIVSAKDSCEFMC